MGLQNQVSDDRGTQQEFFADAQVSTDTPSVGYRILDDPSYDSGPPRTLLIVPLESGKYAVFLQGEKVLRPFERREVAADEFLRELAAAPFIAAGDLVSGIAVKVAGVDGIPADLKGVYDRINILGNEAVAAWERDLERNRRVMEEFRSGGQQPVGEATYQRISGSRSLSALTNPFRW